MPNESKTIGHNIYEMRIWSGNISDSAKEYDDAIKKLYSIVDNLVTTEFTGGLSKELEEVILNQRQTFNDVTRTLEECAELIVQTSNKIEDDEVMLKASFESSNILNS